MIQKALISLMILACLSCREPERKGGVCISFDDRFVKEWSAMSPLFDRYNAHVTFFVTQFDSLHSDEIAALKNLESRGHEIGSHGALHVFSEYFIKENSYEEYLSREVDASIHAMNNHGFYPTSFAYPYGSKYWFTDILLLKRFTAVRTVAAFGDTTVLSDMDEIYYRFDHKDRFSAISFDRNSHITKTMITDALNRAARDREVVFMFGHSPSLGSGNEYSFDPALLEFILAESKRLGLSFYTFSDFTAPD